VQQLKGTLDAKRAELASAREALAAASADDAEGETAEGEATPAETAQAKVDSLQAEVASLSDQVYGKLIEFINSAGLVEGQPLTPEQRGAFDLKAEMDIAIAQEYIDRGGDYQRAINIYDTALASDKDNAKLLAARAEAERLQHMDEARFSQVKKGMSQEEVRALLGTVKSTNVREFNEKDRLGWFYRKQDGGAAGVYFKRKKDGGDTWIVETADFNAVKPPSAGGSESE
jgi:hypothetical protein